MNLSKTIIFPGTFNPIQNDHLKIAEEARKLTGADKVIFVPAFAPYHKEDKSNASAMDRLEMTKLGTQDNPHFAVSDIEYQMGEKKSYTINLVKKLIQDFGGAIAGTHEKLKLIIGADSFENLDKWYNIQELAKLVKFIVAPRATNKPLNDIKQTIKTKDIDYQELSDINPTLSSTLVREKVAKDEDISELVPKSVMDYIKEHKLYRKVAAFF